jgi:nicotinate-nucleotide adenylyltransferase
MKKRILLFGGTFDPPHLGHKALVDHAGKILKSDKIIVIPCFVQPLKNACAANHEQRLDMTKFMFDEVSDLELSRHGTSYSIDTIKHYKKEFAKERLMFVMGTDSFESLTKWKSYKEILKTVNIVIVSRGLNGDISQLVRKAGLDSIYTSGRIIDKDIQVAYSRGYKMLVMLFDFNYPVSSTMIRELIGRRDESAIKYLDSRVWDYIIEHDLYCG